MIDKVYIKWLFYEIKKKSIINIEGRFLKLSSSKNLLKYTATNIFCEKANALLIKKLYKEAASNYLNAILIDRKNAQSYYGLGICYKNLKKYSKAIKYLSMATELKEDFYEAYYELGICCLNEGSTCAAIKNFVSAIQINPDNPDAILQLGIAHELCEEYELALMIYQKLIENSRGFLKAYEHKSTLLMKLEKYKEAAQNLGQLIKLNPDFYNAYIGLGVCFEKLGRTSDAQRYYRKFIQMKPFSQKTEFAKNRLEKIKHTKDLKQKRYLKIAK